MAAEKKSLEDFNMLADLCKNQFEITSNPSGANSYTAATDAHHSITKIINLAERLGLTNKSLLEENGNLLPPSYFKKESEFRSCITQYHNIASGIMRNITSTRQTDRHPKVVRKEKQGVALPSITDFS